MAAQPMDHVLSAGLLVTGEPHLTPEGQQDWRTQLAKLEMEDGQSPNDWAADLVLSTNALSR